MDAGKSGHFIFQLSKSTLGQKSCKTCISTDFCHFGNGLLIWSEWLGGLRKLLKKMASISMVLIATALAPITLLLNKSCVVSIFP